MKKTLLIIFIYVLSIGKSYSQDPVLLPPFGHTAFATDFDISADSKTIASLGLDGHLILWDIAAQKPWLKTLAHYAEGYSVRYSWNGAYIITSAVDGYVRVWDNKGNYLNELNTGSPNLYAELDRTESKLAVASFDGHVRVYEFPSLKLLFDIEASKSKLNCAVFSTNSRLVFTGDEDGVLNAYDIENDGKSLLNLKLDAAVKMVAFDWSGSAMIIHTMNGYGEILLLPKFESIGRLPIPIIDYKSGAAQFASQMDISPDSKWLAFGNSNGQVQIVSGETMVAAAKSGEKFETTMIPLPHTDFIGKVKFSPDMKYLISLGHDRKFSVMEIKGIDLSKIENQFISVGILRQYSDYIQSIYFDDDKNIHMRGFHTYSWDLKNGDHYSEQIIDTRDQFLRDELENVKYDGKTFFIDVKRDIVLLDQDGKLTDVTKVFWSNRRTKCVFTYDGKVFVYDVKSKTITNSYKEPWAFKPEVAAVSEEGDFLLANEKEIKAYDIKGKNIWTKKYDFGIYDLDISHNGWVAVGNYGKELPVLFLKDGKEKVNIKVSEAEAQVVCFLPDADKLIYSGYLGGIYMAELSTKSKKLLIESGDRTVFAMSASDDGKMIATIGYDRVIRLYSIEIKKQLYDVFTMQENGMAVVTDGNYYMSDKKAYQELAYYYNGKVFTGDQFDAYYNRPDLVLNASPYADASYVSLLSEAWKKRMKRLGISGAEIHESSTDISLNNQQELKRNTKEDHLELDIKITDSISKVDRVLITLNDVPIHGRAGKIIEHDVKIKSVDLKVTVPILPDQNVIKIVAIDENGIASMPQVIKIDAHIETKPDLYLVTVGTSKYKDERFNLDYAAKDAGDINSLFKNHDSYSKVNSLSLTDEKVNSRSMAEIKSFLKKAKPTDVVMVFVAGHGLLDAEMNYYLATNETNFLKPSEGGIKYEEFEKMFDEVASIRKTLLLDACHSGELDKDEVAMTTAQTTKTDKVKFRNSGAGVLTSETNAKTSLLVKELFADMRAGTGATVLSSAGGAEYAIESADYKNGLFTFSMIDGLKNMKADLNGDGKVMLSELQQFVSGNVLQLSDGKQKPTSRVENLSMDFQVW